MQPWQDKKIGVLMGGSSSEREISLRSGNAVLSALQAEGLNVVGIDLNGDWAKQIAAANIDVAMILLHGTLGEDGCVQGMLEIMGIPYTNSGVMASALCMNKHLCKTILTQAGLKTPAQIPLTPDGPLRYPVILKPVAEGSSVGLHRLQNREQWQALGISMLRDWMAEMPVNGVEIAVSVLNGKALPPVEVAPKSGVYDFSSKYTKGATEYFCPARLPAETLRACMQAAEEACRVAGCRGAPRVDIIVADGGQPVILEINTIPGMTETSLLPKSAAQAGIGFSQLCLELLSMAQLDHASAESLHD